MNDQQIAFLSKLLAMPSPTGREWPLQEVWAREIRKHADSVGSDSYGNHWARADGTAGEKGQMVMLEAHADEIGFMINHISDDGFISLAPAGGSDPTIARGKRIRFFGDHGEVRGIIANTAMHLRKDEKDSEKMPKWEDLFVDIGVDSAEGVAKEGLRVGHYAVYENEPMELAANRITSRAIDNKISGYILARVLEELNMGKSKVAPNVVAVNAVQEEGGSYGARMAAYRLRPDLALVFDVTHATDSPGISQKKFGAVKLGQGPTLTHGTANHPLLVQRLIDVAEKAKIPIQHEASSRVTGTDADDIFISRAGIPSALISIPLRYMHSPVELVDTHDVENAIALTCAFLRDLKAEENFDHQWDVW